MNNRHKTIALLGEDGVRKSILPKFIVHYACVLYMEMASMHEEKKKITSCIFPNSQRNILGHFKSLKPVAMSLIKNIEFDNHSWYVCYIPRTMPGTLKLIKCGNFPFKPNVCWERQMHDEYSVLLPKWETTEFPFSLPNQRSVCLTKTVRWFLLPSSSRFLKRACWSLWTPSQKWVSENPFSH